MLSCNENKVVVYKQVSFEQKKMAAKIRQGQFEVIGSCAIKRRNEFHLIENLEEGIVKENWFVNVLFKSSISLTLKITAIGEVDF